jgi:hypothetical protein
VSQGLAGRNNLFGRAGAKSDRPAASTSTSTTTPATVTPTPATTEMKEEKKGEMTNPDLLILIVGESRSSHIEPADHQS